MHIVRSILLLMTGAVSGIAFVLSCGDNLSAKANADGAVDEPKAPVCDCPAAEPPLAGRFVRINETRTLGPNGFVPQSASCPAGSQLISGSCTQNEINPYRRLTLEQSGFYGEGSNEWFCFFRNNETRDVTIRVSVTCLLPAP
jgi:hypothetical protein